MVVAVGKLCLKWSNIEIGMIEDSLCKEFIIFDLHSSYNSWAWFSFIFIINIYFLWKFRYLEQTIKFICFFIILFIFCTPIFIFLIEQTHLLFIMYIFIFEILDYSIKLTDYELAEAFLFMIEMNRNRISHSIHTGAHTSVL